MTQNNQYEPLSNVRQKIEIYLFPEEADALDALASATGDNLNEAVAKAIKQRLRFIRANQEPVKR
jgi:hypothetical protein